MHATAFELGSEVPSKPEEMGIQYLRVCLRSDQRSEPMHFSRCTRVHRSPH